MHESFKTQATSGVRWSSLTTVVTTVLQFVRVAVLACLVGPEAFGQMAMVLIVIGFAQLLSDMGLAAAVIQRKTPTREHLASLYWLNVSAGVIVYSVTFVAAPWIAAGFGVPELTSLVRVAALSFVIGAAGALFHTLLVKALRFDRIAGVSIPSEVVNGLVAIACALLGLGVWSLVWGSLAAAVIRTGLLVINAAQRGDLPRLHFRWRDTRGYLGFGLYEVGSSALNLFNSRVDQMVIGVLLGPVTLGYYNIALRLAMEPIQKLNPILTQVAFPIFSRVQDDTELLRRGFLKMARLLMFVNAPALITLAATASLIVPLIVGEEWRPAVRLIQVLAFYTLIRSLVNSGGSVIIAKGKANWAFYWNIALTVVIPPVIYLSGRTGDAVNVCYALVATQATLFLCHYTYFIRRLLGPCLLQYVTEAGRPVLLALIAGLTGGAVAILLDGLPAPLLLAIEITLIGGAYLALSWTFNRSPIIELLSFLPARRRVRDLAVRRIHRGKERFCPICGAGLKAFLPFGDPPRADALCPVCHSLERHRFLWTVLARGRSEDRIRWHGRLLHVAPEPVLAKALGREFDYLSLDIEPGRAMVTGDLTKLDFPDGSFDVVLCNHVLEHIRDDRSALREIHRVLRPGGWASLLVPMAPEPATREAPEGASPEYMMEHHGQDDHVRTYGLDYRNRVTDAGFRVHQVIAAEILAPAEATRLGIPLGETCILGLKR
ncbi:MAG: MOP flippase family protein [Pseudomonadota bacterium]